MIMPPSTTTLTRYTARTGVTNSGSAYRIIMRRTYNDVHHVGDYRNPSSPAKLTAFQNQEGVTLSVDSSYNYYNETLGAICFSTKKNSHRFVFGRNANGTLRLVLKVRPSFISGYNALTELRRVVEQLATPEQRVRKLPIIQPHPHLSDSQFATDNVFRQISEMLAEDFSEFQGVSTTDEFMRIASELISPFFFRDVNPNTARYLSALRLGFPMNALNVTEFVDRTFGKKKNTRSVRKAVVDLLGAENAGDITDTAPAVSKLGLAYYLRKHLDIQLLTEVLNRDSGNLFLLNWELYRENPLNGGPMGQVMFIKRFIEIMELNRQQIRAVVFRLYEGHNDEVRDTVRMLGYLNLPIGDMGRFTRVRDLHDALIEPYNQRQEIERLEMIERQRLYSLSMGRRHWQEIIKQYDEVVANQKGIRVFAPTNYVAPELYRGVALQVELSNGYTLGPITNPSELLDWGTKLQHCIGSYTQEAVRGESVFFGIRKDGNMHSNIQLSGGIIRQWYGHKNKMVKLPSLVEEVMAVLYHHNLIGAEVVTPIQAKEVASHGRMTAVVKGDRWMPDLVFNTITPAGLLKRYGVTLLDLEQKRAELLANPSMDDNPGNWDI